MKIFLSIIRYIRNYKGYATLNIVFNLFSIVFSLVSLTMVVPFLGLLFDKVALVKEAPALTFSATSLINLFYYLISHIIISYGKVNALIFVCFLVLLMFFLKNLTRYLALYFVAPVYNGIVKDIRNDIFNKLLNLPLGFYTEQKKGDIMARASSDVEEIKWTITGSLEIFFQAPLTIIIYLVTLFIWSPLLTLFVLLLLPLTVLGIGRIAKTLKSTSIKGQQQVGIILSILEETLSGLRIIKAFSAENIMREKFDRVNVRYTRTMTSIVRKRDLSAPMSEFMGAIVVVVLMWFGGRMVLGAEKTLNAELFIAYIVIFSQIIPPAKTFSQAYYNIQKGIASMERVSHILNAEVTLTEKPNALPIADLKSQIEYRNVSFAYEKELVLNSVNAVIAKGKSVALVGASGGGKSTFADLLVRFHDVTSGDILIDGVSVKDYKVPDLRNLMGIVTQESILFNDTIFNNIAFGCSVKNLDEVIAAAKVANAHDFIMEMENGYNSYIGDRGCKLSGGQKQRISIARAVLKNPPILLLDEATSALDSESERLVQGALFNLMKNRTSIVIAHRLSTIQSADEIYVLQKGEIIERGSHAELLALNGVYKKLNDLNNTNSDSDYL